MREVRRGQRRGGHRKRGGNVSSVLGNASAGRLAAGPRGLQGSAPALLACRPSSPAPTLFSCPTSHFTMGVLELVCWAEGWLQGPHQAVPVCWPGISVRSRDGTRPAAPGKLLQQLHPSLQCSVMLLIPCCAGTGRREVSFLPS